MKTGVLLVNLGTPDAPETGAVRRYLRPFLSDPRVIDIPAAVRWFLVNLIILPLRPRKSAEAYREVWTDEGSPLLVHGKALRDAVSERLADVPVELAMRYGNPSIQRGLDALHAQSCDRIVVFPLYPQYASSSTGSTLEVVYKTMAEEWNTPHVTVVPPFFDDEGFVKAFAAVGRPTLEELQPDHVLMSFHGLPERHMTKSDEGEGHCLSDGCCERMVDANRNCYRAQCYVTARALAAELGLEEGTWSVAFQSRLGRTPWIQPYTDEVLPALAKKGVKRVAVYCPAFVADCLETIEEIGMRAKEDFTEAGGERLELVPSLNASEAWADAATALIRETAPWLGD